MKKTICLGLSVSLTLAAIAPSLGASYLSEDDLRSHDLGGGPATGVLPGGSMIHVQFNNLFGAIEGFEGTIVPALPVRALPPDVQDLLKADRPLMTLLGMQMFQEPLDPAVIRNRIGIDVEAPLSLTLYPGDPRRMFILSVTMGNRAELRWNLTGLLQPRRVEQVTLSGHRAVRIEPGNLPGVNELYLVCSDEVLYLCGDRSLAIALHTTPDGQRLDRDPFMGRELREQAQRHVAVVCNVGLVRPLALQLQHIRPLAQMILEQQRHQLLAQIPDEARRPIEMRLRAELGVRDLAELAEFVEGILAATMEQALDAVTGELLAFEGLSFTAHLDPGFPSLEARFHSRRFDPETCTAAIPLDEVRQTLGWLGEGSGSIKVIGRKPERAASPVVSAWTTRVRNELAARRLKSRFFDELAQLLTKERALNPIQTRVDWTLAGYHQLTPWPKIEDAPSLSDYFSTLSLPIDRAVRVLPRSNLALLESWLEDQVEARNVNRELGIEFGRSISGQQPWFIVENRLLKQPAMAGVRRYVLEDAIMTRGGLFGYDQHELVNRRILSAREIRGNVVFHQGRLDPVWLAGLTGQRSDGVTVAVEKLLARVPAGANRVVIHRNLQHLPAVLGWLSGLEGRVHADLTQYLEACAHVWRGNEPEAARLARIEEIPMPETVYALCFDRDTETLYCLLPGNIPFPRGRVLPILEDLLADYAAAANDVGGVMLYSRTRPELFEMGIVQSTEGLARLIASTGNRVHDRYLSQPWELEGLRQRIMSPYDGHPDLADHVLVVNPSWGFLPGPHPKRDAAPTQPIPSRAVTAGKHLIDLTPFYHAALTETWHSGGLPNNTLAHLPRGIQTFGGVQFDVRGVVQLSGRGAAEALDVRFPKVVEGIPIGQQTRRIHFLHAAGWASPDGTVIGWYQVRYSDGQTLDIPIVYGEDLRDWWAQIDDTAAGGPDAVWSGPNTAVPDGPSVSLYKTTWVNPRPNVRIDSIDYRSAMEHAAPFLIGLTVEPTTDAA